MLLAATPYDFFVPFFACVTKVAGMIECDRLGDIDYFLPRKFVTEII